MYELKRKVDLPPEPWPTAALLACFGSTGTFTAPGDKLLFSKHENRWCLRRWPQAHRSRLSRPHSTPGTDRVQGRPTLLAPQIPGAATAPHSESDQTYASPGGISLQPEPVWLREGTRSPAAPVGW